MSSRPGKRKADDGEKFYAVRVGLRPGVYTDWEDVKNQISGYKGSLFRKFTSLQDASDYVEGKEVQAASSEPKPTKYYAVAVGRQTGIYNDWNEAKEYIEGVKGPKYKRFDTRREAVAFIKQYGSNEAIKALGEEVRVEQPPAKRVKTTAHASKSHLAPETKSYAKAKAEKEEAPGAEDIYTDGCSLANGRKGARAGVGVWFSPGDPRNISERLSGEPQTNQRAELKAIIRALECVPPQEPVRICTDSQYSINCAEKWSASWEKNGWKTASGNPVKNADLVRTLVASIKKRAQAGASTTFKWIPGHAGIFGNEAADRLAKAGAEMPVGGYEDD